MPAADAACGEEACGGAAAEGTAVACSLPAAGELAPTAAVFDCIIVDMNCATVSSNFLTRSFESSCIFLFSSFITWVMVSNFFSNCLYFSSCSSTPGAPGVSTYVSAPV